MADPSSGTSPEVTVERCEDHVALVEFHRPPNNFFDVDLVNGIADRIWELAASGEGSAACRVVVLASEGKNFCAGAQLAESVGASTGTSTADALYAAGLRLLEQPLPLVAAVQGAAIGGGLGLALMADFRVVGRGSRLSANFARLGFHHGFGISATLPRVVGQQRALDLLYTGRRIHGEEAVAMGLGDRLAADDHVRAQAIALASEIASSAPLAVRSIRETMRADLVAGVREVMDREAAEQARLRSTDDRREGVAAAAERRAPVFVGR